MNKKQIFALIKWIGGKYDGTYTPGVPINWIRDFNPQSFDPEEEDDEQSYIVQWRHSSKGKIPKGGWKYYDAQVVEISNDKDLLEEKLKILEGVVSPLRLDNTKKHDTINLNKRMLEKEYDDEEPSPPKKKKKSTSLDNKTKKIKRKTKQLAKQSIMIDSDNDDEVIIKKRSIISLNRNKKKYIDSDSDDNDEDTTPKRSIVSINHNEKENINSDNDDDDENTDNYFNLNLEKNKSNSIDNQTIVNALINLSKEIRNMKKPQNNDVYNNEDNNQVPLGPPKFNVFVTREQWKTADSRADYRKMGVSLVEALFSDEELINSNLRGGKSKIDKNQPRKPALDKNIIAAIEAAVKAKFPGEYKKGLFGTAINNFLSSKRSQNKKAIENEVSSDSDQ